jgi:hypothetical protein
MSGSNEIIVVEKSMLRSKAYRSLTATSLIVFNDFLMKRKMKKIKGTHNRKGEITITNNGKIEYCYTEALKKDPPITRPAFSRALDQLIELGFLEIAHQGSGGVKGDKSLYAVSSRWEKFGTPDFKSVKRRKDIRKGRGFSRYWEIKKQTTVTQALPI